MVIITSLSKITKDIQEDNDNGDDDVELLMMILVM